MKKPVNNVLILILAGIMTFVLSYPVSATVIVEDGNSYDVTLVSVMYEAGVQNLIYNITCLSGHGISHIVFEFKEICDPPLKENSKEFWRSPEDPTYAVIELKPISFEYMKPGSFQAVKMKL